MNELKVFNSEEFGKVRVTVIKGESWFVAKDVSDILGYVEVSSMRKLLDDNEYMEINPQKPEFKGFVQNGSTFRMLMINESGVYHATFNSTLPKAKSFRVWATSEVLPSIRKYGGYIAGQEKMTDEELLSQALVVANNKIRDRDELIAKMQPKADFYDAVANSEDAFDMGTVAKILNIPNAGRNNMFDALRHFKIFMSDNIPYQKYMKGGCFKVIEEKFQTTKGEIKVKLKTMVTQKGLNRLRIMFTKEQVKLYLSNKGNKRGIIK